MPIKIDSEGQALVDCEGDIVLAMFFPESNGGKATLLMAQGEPGEPGRTLTEEEVPDLGRMVDFTKQAGVYIQATDYRSLDSIINGLTKLRDRLRDGPPSSTEADIVRKMGDRIVQDIHDECNHRITEALGGEEAAIARGIAKRTAEDVDRDILNDLIRANRMPCLLEILAFKNPVNDLLAIAAAIAKKRTENS